MIIKNTNEQLELTIAAKPCNTARRQGRRVTTARLWFARMRQIVDSAPDRPARPLQPPLIPARAIALSSPSTGETHLAE